MSMNMHNNDQYINHEVRIQLTEKLIERFDIKSEKIDDEFKAIHQEMKSIRKDIHNQFLTTIGIIITLFGGMILTKILS